MKCPIATQDIHVNLENRNHAFEEYGYGPANPELDNEEFWAERAEEWNTSPDNAKTMRCGNCSAFIQTPEMMGCIIGGIQKEESDDETYAPEVVDSADLGYCDKRKQMLAIAKYEARKGEYENESGEEDLEGDD
jgi:hypothetical protein